MFYRQVIVERRLPFQPAVAPTLDERIITAAIKNAPSKVELTTDKDGNILVDKELHPEVNPQNWRLQ
jgi:antitoxin component of RelBE/YafQ-DinJ toxin-antitoxin module